MVQKRLKGFQRGWGRGQRDWEACIVHEKVWEGFSGTLETLRGA